MVEGKETSNMCSTQPVPKGAERPLADTVKAHHYRLRVRALELGDPGKAWEEHLRLENDRRSYASAMAALAASESWQSDGNDRLDWCRSTAIEFYGEHGLLKRTIEKDLRRKRFESGLSQGIPRDQIDPLVEVKATWNRHGPWRLLDVGSCFNGFAAFKEFTVDAVDLTPAHPSVHQCDFLNVVPCHNSKYPNGPEPLHQNSTRTNSNGSHSEPCTREISFKAEKTNEEKKQKTGAQKRKHDGEDNQDDDSQPDETQRCSCTITENGNENNGKERTAVRCLPNQGYDVVVFSLLLSYFPGTTQRFQCVRTAWALLRENGLLLVITPDSNHHNKGVQMMKDWRKAIEAVGFSRIKYHKHPHLHCLAFRRLPDSECQPLSDDDISRLHPLLAIGPDRTVCLAEARTNRQEDSITINGESADDTKVLWSELQTDE